MRTTWPLQSIATDDHQWVNAVLECSIFRPFSFAQNLDVKSEELAAVLHTFTSLFSSHQQASHRLFETSDVPLYQDVYRNLHYHPRSEVMSLVARGEHGFICHKTPIEFSIVTKYSKSFAETKLHVAQEDFLPGGYHWGFPKVSYHLLYSFLSWQSIIL